MTFFGSQFFVGTSKPRSMKRCRPIPMTCCMADIAADFFICFSRRGVFRLCMASQFRNAKTNGVFYTTKGPNHHSKGQALPTALFRRYYNFSVSPFYFQPFLGAKKWWFQRCWILFTLKPGSFWSNLTKKPWKLTWQWKIHHERRCGEIYHCYVSLPEGNIFPMGDSITSSFFCFAMVKIGHVFPSSPWGVQFQIRAQLRRYDWTPKHAQTTFGWRMYFDDVWWKGSLFLLGFSC